jgi:hypothetical protein
MRRAFSAACRQLNGGNTLIFDHSRAKMQIESCHPHHIECS